MAREDGSSAPLVCAALKRETHHCTLENWPRHPSRASRTRELASGKPWSAFGQFHPAPVFEPVDRHCLMLSMPANLVQLWGLH